MTEYLIRKLELRDALSQEEKDVLHSAVGTVRDIGPNEEIVREGGRPANSVLVLEGFTCRYSVLAGGERQITSLHVPGDFVDLHGFLIKTMDHSVGTLTQCKLGLVPHPTLKRITERYPHLARMLWLMTLVDAAIHRRWLTAMGRQSALSHTAHLLCEMYVRQKEVLLGPEATFRMPLSQAKLADALGLSAVHTNRVIRELREGGYIDWQGELVTVKDWDGLVRLAEFDPTYLSLQKEPR